MEASELWVCAVGLALSALCAGAAVGCMAWFLCGTNLHSYGDLRQHVKVYCAIAGLFLLRLVYWSLLVTQSAAGADPENALVIARRVVDRLCCLGYYLVASFYSSTWVRTILLLRSAKFEKAARNVYLVVDSLVCVTIVTASVVRACLEALSDGDENGFEHFLKAFSTQAVGYCIVLVVLVYVVLGAGILCMLRGSMASRKALAPFLGLAPVLVVMSGVRVVIYDWHQWTGQNVNTYVFDFACVMLPDGAVALSVLAVLVLTFYKRVDPAEKARGSEDRGEGLAAPFESSDEEYLGSIDEGLGLV